MEKYTISLVCSDGSEYPSVFQFDDGADECMLRLTFDDREYSAAEEDYFAALCIIREQIEDIGMRPKCYGAHVAAYPSGMSRNMGQGLKIYKLTLGQRGRMDDLVHIFDVGDDVVPATVVDQQAYFERWCRSLTT